MEAILSYEEIIKKAKRFVETQLRPAARPFYKQSRAKETEKWVVMLSESLNSDELFLVRMAALLAHVGIQGGYEGHTERSAVIAEQKSLGFGCSRDEARKIAALIRSTDYKARWRPQSELEKTLSDAENAHFADESRKNFVNKTILNFAREVGIKDRVKALNEILERMKGHEYYTHKAKGELDPIKELNKRAVKQLIAKHPAGEGQNTLGPPGMRPKEDSQRTPITRKRHPGRGISELG